jgi:hypothetical protein
VRSATANADPSTPWPHTASEIPDADIVFDADGMGHAGITGIPKTDAGFYPPHVGTSFTSPAVDSVYLVARTTLGVSGASTSCTETSGQASVTGLYNLVIGCHKIGGGECTPVEWQFVASYMPVYEVMSGTFQAKTLGDATVDCTAVLAALP